MENILKEKLLKTKDIILFILLFLWMIMPIAQTFRTIHEIVDLSEMYLVLMKLTGVVGIGTSIFYLFDKFENAENKKQVLKDIVPIILFIVYMGWTLVSCFLSPNKKQAFEGNFYRREGYYMYINYAGYFLCAFLLENKKLRKILLNTFLIASVFLILISRICLDGQRFTDVFVNTEIDTTVFAQFNHYGYYLMMSLICCLGLFTREQNKILKMVYLVGYTIIGYATIHNDTFGCYLATLTFLILYGIYALIKKTDRKVIFIAITIFTLLSCITFKADKNVAYKNISNFAKDIKIVFLKITNNYTEDEEIEQDFDAVGTYRMALWINGIKFVLEKPVIGYGPDNLRPKYADVSIEQDRPHNLLIYLAAVSGIPGMLIYVTAVGIIVVKGIKKLVDKNKDGMIFLIVVITYLISSMFGNSMFYTSPYFFIFLGSLMNNNLCKQDK